MSKSKSLIAFDQNGNLGISVWGTRVASSGNRYTFEEGVFVPIFEFQDTLVYDGFFNGTSTAWIKLKSTVTGKIYHISMTLADELISSKGLPKDGILGRWTFKKQGNSFSLVWLGDIY